MRGMSEDVRKKSYVRATPAALRARDLLLSRIRGTDLVGMPSLEEMTPALWMWLVNEDPGAIARGIAPHLDTIRDEVAAAPDAAGPPKPAKGIELTLGNASRPPTQTPNQTRNPSPGKKSRRAR